MWTGTINFLEHETDPECWSVWIDTPEGGLYKDCATEEVWNTLTIGQEYTLTNPQEF
jgi:hypothetical protein